MTYVPGTILKRTNPFTEDDTEYNTIKVIGQADTVSVGHKGGEWEGEQGQEVTITPHEAFGAVVDRPEGELRRDYEVVSIPDQEPVTLVKQERPKIDPTPEEAFKKDEVRIREPESRERKK